eukprot:1183368-Prorocentrum_minimum.AAC.1
MRSQWSVLECTNLEERPVAKGVPRHHARRVGGKFEFACNIVRAFRALRTLVLSYLQSASLNKPTVRNAYLHVVVRRPRARVDAQGHVRGYSARAHRHLPGAVRDGRAGLGAGGRQREHGHNGEGLVLLTHRRVQLHLQVYHPPVTGISSTPHTMEKVWYCSPIAESSSTCRCIIHPSQ